MPTILTVSSKVRDEVIPQVNVTYYEDRAKAYGSMLDQFGSFMTEYFDKDNAAYYEFDVTSNHICLREDENDCHYFQASIKEITQTEKGFMPLFSQDAS